MLIHGFDELSGLEPIFLRGVEWYSQASDCLFPGRREVIFGCWLDIA